MTETNWKPEYSPWRHGGWYVTNAHYPGGACGCVSNNYDDKKWRIACGPLHSVTFPSRDAAARAEKALTLFLSDAKETARHLKDALGNIAKTEVPTCPATV